MSRMYRNSGTQKTKSMIRNKDEGEEFYVKGMKPIFNRTIE